MSRIRGIAIATALLATIASTLSVYPHQLAYFNEAAGGPENGHKHLLGSNLDWGQDLLYLKKWQARTVSSDPLYLKAHCSSWAVHIGVHGSTDRRPLVFYSDSGAPGLDHTCPRFFLWSPTELLKARDCPLYGGDRPPVVDDDLAYAARNRLCWIEDGRQFAVYSRVPFDGFGLCIFERRVDVRGARPTPSSPALPNGPRGYSAVP